MLHFAPTNNLYGRQSFAYLRLSVSKSLSLALLLLLPVAAHAQGSPFDTGFNAIQSLFTGTIAKVASLVAIRDRRLRLRARRTRGKKGAPWGSPRNRNFQSLR